MILCRSLLTSDEQSADDDDFFVFLCRPGGTTGRRHMTNEISQAPAVELSHRVSCLEAANSAPGIGFWSELSKNQLNIQKSKSAVNVNKKDF